MRKMMYLALVAVVLVAPAYGQDSKNTTAAKAAAGEGFASDGSKAPHLDSTVPVVGGAVGLQLTNARPGATAYLAIGAATSTVYSFAGGNLFLDPATAFVAKPFVVPQTGTWSLATTLDVPKSMIGEELHLQFLVLDAVGPQEGKQFLSSALWWRLGL